MKKFNTLCSRVIPLDLDNIDTDMIIPAEHLKSISKEGYGSGLFSGLRELYPDFIFNNPAYSGAKVLVSKTNFGCGSSREHAVWAILQYGIQVVVCESFGDIFFNNAAKNGLLLISQPLEVIKHFIESTLTNSQLEITVNLHEQQISFMNKVYGFNYDPYRKHCLINGQDDLDYLLSCDEEISNYEKKYCNTSR